MMAARRSTASSLVRHWGNHMSGASKKLMGTTAAGGEALAIEDVFSVDLFPAVSGNRDITNGIDLSTEGGMVWTKCRNVGSTDWYLGDTENGPSFYIRSNTTGAGQSYTTAFDYQTDGVILGSGLWPSLQEGVAFTFRKAPRFFDVVTWTGDGVLGRTVSHNLGSAPGFIVIKSTSRADAWYALHKDSNMLILNQSTAELSTAVTADYFGDGTNIVRPTDTSFMIGNDAGINGSGETYVAYLFAHDPLGPSGDGSDGLIACGSYTGNGADDGPTISLGWEPQWLLIKRSAGGTGEWILVDTMRGMTADGSVAFLEPNTSDAEVNNNYVRPTADGFKLTATGSVVNASGSTYIYIAIRRGPMRAPTSGTEVFAIDTMGSTSGDPAFKSNFVVDMALYKRYNDTQDWAIPTRLMGLKHLKPNSTDVEIADGTVDNFAFNTGYNNAATNSNYYSWMWKRAPGYFDVVAYTGDSPPAGRAVPHNLTVTPEMIWVKNRNGASGGARPWIVYHKDTGNTGYLKLNENSSLITTDPESKFGNGTVAVAPTATDFTVAGDYEVNFSGDTYIAYLFATLPGVSKVGSFTATGSVLDIDCGFTSGARFVLIKRTDTTGEWFLFDTARGITISTSPWLPLNTSSGENIANYIDPLPSGFRVTTDFYGSGDFIFLAIA
jgi:hypothetical protein